MPEGDTIAKLARYLDGRLAGRAPTSLRARDLPGLDLGGRRVERVRAHGKHLFVELADGVEVRSHLGLHGTWHRYPRDAGWKRPRRHASLVIETDDDVYVCFHAKEVEVLRTRGLRARDVVGRLGPDLLVPHDAAALPPRARALCAPSAPLVDVLLDQRVAAGVGNVYKSELLFLGRLHPLAALGDVTDAALQALYERAAELLAANLGGGARVTRPVRDGTSSVWVYGRHGLPCLRCGERVVRRRLGGGRRSTYWCPACQPEAVGAP